MKDSQAGEIKRRRSFMGPEGNGYASSISAASWQTRDAIRLDPAVHISASHNESDPCAQAILMDETQSTLTRGHTVIAQDDKALINQYAVCQLRKVAWVAE
jgi:hypothetical protein